jgi:ACS family tartrate transporter-like MFS transporter
MATGKTVAASDIATGTIRRVRNRLIPLLFLLYLIAFLDRTNIGFAALTMNPDLALTSAQFGLLTGIFFWGYCLFIYLKFPAICFCTRSARARGSRAFW